MPRSTSVAAIKLSSKKKDKRSVSTLTPSQLERKRARDRDAQRAIRTRTKEHIDRLEREISELKSALNHHHTLQDLEQKNRMLKKELERLREGVVQSSDSSFSASVCVENSSPVVGAVPSPHSSLFPATGSFAGMAELGSSNMPLQDTARETWAPAVHVSSADRDACGVPAYIPACIPATMMEAGSTQIIWTTRTSTPSFSYHSRTSDYI